MREEIPAKLVRWKDVTPGETALFGENGLHEIVKIIALHPEEGKKGRRYLGVKPSVSEYREYLRLDDGYATVVLESGA